MAEEKVATSPAPADAPASDPPPSSAQKGDETEMKDEKDNKPEGSSKDDSEKPADDGKAAPEKDDEAGPADPAPVSTPAADKSKSRRKSGATGSAKKKPNKKVKPTYTDAQPGDHFLVKLKGYPIWPCIICSEDMLPEQLLKTRPVSAARSDGSYREDFADGGKRISDRTFPVMYLHTNEFGWVCNKEFIPFDKETITKNVSEKMRKDVASAYELANENHDLDYYKNILTQFEEEAEEFRQEQEAARAAAAAKKAAKKSKAPPLEEEDVSMLDMTDDEPKSSRKRKAEDEGNRTESVKKPKIKLTSNPKPLNGASTPAKSKTAATTKSSKPKPKPKKEEKVTPAEPELSPEAIQQRKEKEVLWFRHKLQRGLLTKDEPPKHDDMPGLSEYMSKLEVYPDLDVEIIRKTKINKVLKNIIKLESIPQEEKFKFKARSAAMLDKWHPMITAAASGTPQPSKNPNGVNGSAEKDKANGVEKEGSKDEEKEVAA